VVDPSEFQKAIQREKAREDRFKSKVLNPRYRGYQRGMIRPDKHYSMKLLRRIGEKAWLINTVVGHITDKVVPYIRPMSAKGRRGFAIELKDPDAKMTKAQEKKAKEYQQFFLQAGWGNKIEHEDDLVHYVKKILRDLLMLDQVATELLWTRGGQIYAFEAIDAATIVRCTEEGYDGDDKIRFVQMIDSQVVTQYTSRDILFQFSNPRTDVDNYGYGYSKVEQAVDLVVSLINSFAYNAGAFTEDHLPRGMLLLSGDTGFDEVQEIEDYIVDMMMLDGVTNATGKWGIPIIPTGMAGDKSSISWQKLGESNQDMQFSRWQDTLYMSIGALYGVDMESMGIKTEKSARLIESGSTDARKYSDDKGIGATLTFLERHFQKMLDQMDPDFAFVFHGFEQDDSEEVRKTTESALKTTKSMNQLRIENDDEPYDAEWADVPGIANQSISQIFLRGLEQKQQEAAAGEGEFDEGDDDVDYEGLEDNESDNDAGLGKSIASRVIIEI
jgi:hypothetical protein